MVGAGIPLFDGGDHPFVPTSRHCGERRAQRGQGWPQASADGGATRGLDGASTTLTLSL
ncbi:hypothetical protein [Mesorhizobium mediterraneum]|uniref:hypothetical protein n=1 Tax=Mesorhizobium mediterraneum TaxID=43617 RepID=UPI00177B4BA8|nr:hypothetical protein [Mesorhizobium mediterraneum]